MLKKIIQISAEQHFCRGNPFVFPSVGLFLSECVRLLVWHNLEQILTLAQRLATSTDGTSRR